MVAEDRRESALLSNMQIATNSLFGISMLACDRVRGVRKKMMIAGIYSVHWEPYSLVLGRCRLIAPRSELLWWPRCRIC